MLYFKFDNDMFKLMETNLDKIKYGNKKLNQLKNS